MAPTDPRRMKMPQGPPGWRVEARPRTNEKYKGKIDWFYYEPGTRKQYRSHSKAWARYNEINEKKPEVKEEPMTKGECSKSKKDSEEEERPPGMKKLLRLKIRTASFDVEKTPESVTWVLKDAENDKWVPCIGDEMVPEDEQKLWAETFELAMAWKDWPRFEVDVDQKGKAVQAEEEDDADQMDVDQDDQAENEDKAGPSENA